ncbi:hypothetical protein [Rhodococcoides yunnanense]|uniref:PASTA domain-containing protein n=1 Tax=Rhodococcoides yunnanense TaxID=278209 RepID=A0ABU4BI26_9NOCA|nr:hypothetical protein [Rhodococcus yunnanensis]MDV6263855.1 hypothetical protein [Rhodococcus yunnanensis]
MTSSSRFRVRSVIVFALSAIVLAGCGSQDSAEPEVSTEVRTVTVEATAPAPTSIERIVIPDASVPESAVPEPTASEPVLVSMPPVVCMNLQSAQNAIQAVGVFFSRSEDASGEGRMQVNDSNWIVVEQSPAPGTLVGEGDALLSVVKIGEPNNC